MLEIISRNQSNPLLELGLDLGMFDWAALALEFSQWSKWGRWAQPLVFLYFGNSNVAFLCLIINSSVMVTEVFSFRTAAPLRTKPPEWPLTLGPLLLGDEVCAQGGSGIPGVEAEELPPAQAVAAPGPEHAAHDGPGRALHTEGRLSGRRGRRGGGPGHGGQPLSTDRWNNLDPPSEPEALTGFSSSDVEAMATPPPTHPPLFFTELTSVRSGTCWTFPAHTAFRRYFTTHLKPEDEG